ncbi:hypothetical protein ACFQ7J_20980 [Streptomyces sp. NPDC056501]|uniref:hypothetical protein n=1 Tax=Streptomyces sp. NPDC056501 TaxID=3345841 RepID=UPI0036A78C95
MGALVDAAIGSLVDAVIGALIDAVVGALIDAVVGALIASVQQASWGRECRVRYAAPGGTRSDCPGRRVWACPSTSNPMPPRDGRTSRMRLPSRRTERPDHPSGYLW